MMLLDRHFNSSSSRNIALENGIGSTPLWFQATGLYGMMLLRERVNFQVSRKRSFVRVPKPPRTSARSSINVALCVRLYSPADLPPFSAHGIIRRFGLSFLK